MHWSCSIGVILLATTKVSAFVVAPSSIQQRRQQYHELRMTRGNHDNNNPTRRNVLIQSGMLGLSTFLANTSPAQAKQKKESEPLTKENVQAAFDAIRYELEDPKGGIATMQDYIDQQDYEGLLEFTKTYDQILRKAKWGRCKAFLTNNAEKEVATLQGNAVTFDLIGINRASRASQQSQALCQKYLDELKTDLSKMLDMQKTIRYEGEGGFDEYYNSIRGN